MAKTSKTSPFRPTRQTESTSNNEGENKDDENNSSSSSPEHDTQINQDKANRNRQMHVNSERKVIRGRGKSIAYTVRLWSKHNPRIDAHVSSEYEPKPKSSHDKNHVKANGKRSMKANGNQRTKVSKRGRGKLAAYNLRLWSKHHPRSPRKGVNVHTKVKDEIDDLKFLETDLEEVCKGIEFERHDNDDIDDDNDEEATTHRNLTNLGIEILGK